MEYYSAIKKNQLLPLATTWMNLKGITLSEKSQTEKDKYRMISLTCGIKKQKQTKNKNTKFTDTENRLVVARGREVGMSEMGDRRQKVQKVIK